MVDKTINVATRLVDLVLRYGEKWQSEIGDLSEDGIQVLFETVLAAGFDAEKVVPGKLLGFYRDQDGSRTGKTYPINIFCPFKAINQEGSDYYPATGWLDAAAKLVFFKPARKSREELVKTVAEEIERSVPLEPIQLTPEGDLLSEYPKNAPGFSGYFIDHTRDDGECSSCVGVHKYCGGWMDRRRATEKHDAIVCRACYLRALFPKEVKTYGDLRRAFVFH